MSLLRTIITFACVSPTLSSRNRVNKATAANVQNPSLLDGILPQSNHRQTDARSPVRWSNAVVKGDVAVSKTDVKQNG